MTHNDALCVIVCHSYNKMTQKNLPNHIFPFLKICQSFKIAKDALCVINDAQCIINDALCNHDMQRWQSSTKRGRLQSTINGIGRLRSSHHSSKLVLLTAAGAKVAKIHLACRPSWSDITYVPPHLPDHHPRLDAVVEVFHLLVEGADVVWAGRALSVSLLGQGEAVGHRLGCCLLFRLFVVDRASQHADG